MKTLKAIIVILIAIFPLSLFPLIAHIEGLLQMFKSSYPFLMGYISISEMIFGLLLSLQFSKWFDKEISKIAKGEIKINNIQENENN